MLNGFGKSLRVDSCISRGILRCLPKLGYTCQSRVFLGKRFKTLGCSLDDCVIAQILSCILESENSEDHEGFAFWCSVL